MSIPTIAMIPSGYKANKVYSVLPTNGDADLAFTRASEATRVNQNGIIETVGVNVPRLDYSDGGCPSLLLEPQSTNLLTYSEDFTNSGWFKQNDATITPNTTVAPDGTLTASTLSNATGTTITGSVLQNNIAVSNDCTLSIYVKSLGSTTATLSYRTSGNATAQSDKDISDGKWHRLTLFCDTTASDLNQFVLGGTNGDIAVWGAQVEEQSYATSYIPTNGTAVTRAADYASKTGLSSYIGQTQGVLYIEMKNLTDGKLGGIYLNDGAVFNNQIGIYYRDFPRERQLTVRHWRGGATLFFNDFDLGFAQDAQFIKVAVRWSINDITFYINGLQIDTDAGDFSFNSNVLDSLVFLSNSAIKVKQLSVYDSVLSDGELATLTTI